MIIVKEAVENIAKSWGTPEAKDTIYRPIKYLLKTDVADGVLLCNTVTGELVLISGEETDLFESLPAAYDTKMDDLIAHHFLVPADFDEYASVVSLRKILNLYFKPKQITGYTILPTTCCNARCFYCFESDYKQVSMSKETADDTVEFIKNHCGGKKVTLSWFGGEPTLGVIRIDQICNGLAKAGIEYSSTMISNGYLFDRELVKKAKDLWKLRRIQITLDGTEEVYNSVKNYVGIKDSAYKRVLDNIDLLLEGGITVSVRMNLDKHNADNLSLLIDELSVRYKDKKGFDAYVWPLFEDCGYKPIERDLEDQIWLFERQQQLNDAIKRQLTYRSDRHTSLPSLKKTYCMADNDAAVLINPSGTFAKCEHFCEQNIGNVKDGITDYDAVKKWKEPALFSECDTCPLYPACLKLKNCFSAKTCYKVVRENQISDYIKLLKDTYYECKNNNK